MRATAPSVHLRHWCVRFAAILIAMTLAVAGRAQVATNGLIMLIEFEKIEGVRHWERELDRRGLTALIQAQFNVLNEYPKDFERLATKGYPIAGLYAEKPFWDVPYDEQYARMREAKEVVEHITHKPMRLFGSRYFAYDENTLRAADALGIEYVLGRGTAGALATIYAPSEYKAKIISVSNVPFAEMGTGSFCDYSLWARGSTEQGFRCNGGQGDCKPTGRFNPSLTCLSRRNVRAMVADLRKCLGAHRSQMARIRRVGAHCEDRRNAICRNSSQSRGQVRRATTRSPPRETRNAARFISRRFSLKSH